MNSTTENANSTHEKTYLKWYNKVGYGSGDIAGNVVYAFLSAFVMIYLTDTVGLNAGIIGTLMLLSKIFDGVSDLFFGMMIDRTRTESGKARPWMFYGYFGCAITLVAVFAIPTSMGTTAQYAWFFIAYSLLNAGFYTANNIAFSSLTALITKNRSERVQMGSIRFMFAFGTSLLIQTITVGFVAYMGGDAAAWRTVAIIYAIVGLISNTIAVASVRELPESELRDADDETKADDKVSFPETLKLLINNPFYLILLGVYLMTQFLSVTLNMGIYYMTYILGDANLLGVFAWTINIPLIVGLLLVPFIVKAMGGMYKINIIGYAITLIGRILVIVAASMGSLPLMLVFTGLASLGQAPLQGTLSALIAEASEYTYLTKGKRIDGAFFSTTSLGQKIGGGVATAVAGWLLELGGYDGTAEVQTEQALNMISFIYLWVPTIMATAVVVLLFFLRVEKANQKLCDSMIGVGREKVGATVDDLGVSDSEGRPADSRPVDLADPEGDNPPSR